MPEKWRPEEQGHDGSGDQETVEDADSNDIPSFAVQLERAKSEDTPKAAPIEGAAEAIPTFSLSESEKPVETSSMKSVKVLPTSSVTSDAPKTSQMPPPVKPATKPVKSPCSSLMPPPTRTLAPQRGPPPSAAASLRAPAAGLIPNRGPPANSQQRASSGLSPNGAVKTANARGKVLLSPGHSPMDWAALTRTGNMTGVSTFQRVTPSQLRSMTGRKGKPAWSSWQGKVYNITPYLPFHPGGEAELMKCAGRDGTKLFMDAHPWVNWENMLTSCLVGVLVPEDYGTGAGGSSLEDMD